MKQRLEREISVLQKELDKELESIKLANGGVAWFLRHNSKDAFQKEWLLNNYKFILKDMDNCTKEEIIQYLNHEIDKCTDRLLSGKVIHYNTNPMQNLTEMWEFEIYPHYIKELNSLKGLL